MRFGADMMASVHWAAKSEAAVTADELDGTTHLAISLAVRALEEGHKAYFLTLHDLVSRARLARRRDQLHLLLRTIHRADLFVLDELGFLPLAADDATFLFELINKRYQSGKSTIVTSNKSYGQWGQIFPDDTLAVAILDRLLHHATTVSIRGESYRLKNRRDSGLTSLPHAETGSEKGVNFQTDDSVQFRDGVDMRSRSAQTVCHDLCA